MCAGVAGTWDGEVTWWDHGPAPSAFDEVPALAGLEVMVGAERFAAEQAQVLPHAIAVQEPVIERADAGVGLVGECAVEPEKGHKKDEG